MPNADEVAQITAGGSDYKDWKSVMVRRDYGNAVSIFSFSAAEPGPFGEGWTSLRLKPGDEVTVSLAGVQVIKGNITTRDASYDAQGHDLVVQGKSSTMDLVDSSVAVKPGTFSGQTFEQAAKGVMSPHPSSLIIKNPPDIASKPFKSLTIQYGETVFGFIERMARMRGFILTDDEQGNLVASQTDPNAAPVAELQEGGNIKSAHGRLDDQNAWNKLSITGQNVGDDHNWPPRDYSATVENPNARPNRIRTGLAEHPGDAEDMQQRANYEAARCLWPVVQCTIVVQGWKRSDGKLWDVTDNVSVYSPMLFPNEDGRMTLGIQSVVYAQDSENGTTTTLELVLPQALTTVANPHVATDNQGNFIDNPKPSTAQPDGNDV